MNLILLTLLLLFTTPTCTMLEEKLVDIDEDSSEETDVHRQTTGKAFTNAYVSNLLEATNIKATHVNISGNLTVGGSIVSASGSGIGGVNTQGSVTSNSVAIFADPSGKTLKSSPVFIDSSGNITLNGITKDGFTVSWPSMPGSAGTVLTNNGMGGLVYSTPVGTGNVSTALPFGTNNAILTTDTPSGVDNIKQTLVTLDSSNNISGVNSLNVNTVNATTLNGALIGNASSATDFTGPLVGDVTGYQHETVVSSVGGQSDVAVAAAAAAVADATPDSDANTLVLRDSNANFSASTITANLTGNVTGNLSGNAATATFATNAGTAANFSNQLMGDVGGTQSATVVNKVGEQTSSQVASGVIAANAATATNTAGLIVLRDPTTGGFASGPITASLTGNVTGNLFGTADNATMADSATNFTGSLIGDVIGTQTTTQVFTVGGQNASDVAQATQLAIAATSANNIGQSQIVRRDASGNFSATTISANLIGNASSATSSLTSGTSTYFSGGLMGDVTGLQLTTSVAAVGGQSATAVAAAAAAVSAATSDSDADTLVLRDSNQNFSAGIISATLNGNAATATSAITSGTSTYFSGQLQGDVTGFQLTTSVAAVGGQNASQIATGVIAANAATNTATPNTIVSRDSAGSFVSNIITATGGFEGDVTGDLFGNANTATLATMAQNFSGSLLGDVQGTQGATMVITISGQQAGYVAAGAVLANNSNFQNINSAIVRRDGSGNFAASNITATSFIGTLTGNVIGNVTGNVSGSAGTAGFATSAGSATNFSGQLLGDVIGTQTATQVAYVGGVGGASAAAIIATVNTVTNATQNNQANQLVLRDGSSNFATNMITIDGTTTNPTDVATKAYVDNAVATGFTVHPPVLVTSVSPISDPPSGLQTIDGVTVAANNRVLLTAQNNQVNNGIWLAQSSPWTRPADFSSGEAGSAYVLTTSGVSEAGTGWVCTTPTSMIGTSSLLFAQFSSPDSTTAANVGTGVGQIFQNKTGNTLNLKTLSTGSHIVIANNASDVNIGTDGTNTLSPGTLVARDGSNNFAAGTITASLTGAASLNVLKAGDTMTGNLSMANQSALNLQDTTSGNFVGLNAPATVNSSYTVNLPAVAPTAGQTLQATSSTATAWVTSGGGSPTVAKTYYVSLSGSDNNDGSFNAPFRTISKALTVANPLASVTNLILISVGAGIFNENNSGGPLTISSDGITLQGSGIGATTITPSSLTNDLFSITAANIEMGNMTLNIASGTSTGNAVTYNVTEGGISRFTYVAIFNYQTGFALNSSGTPIVQMENVQLAGNGTAVTVNNTQVVAQNSLFRGPFVATAPAANTGFSITGQSSQIILSNSLIRGFVTGFSTTGGARSRLLSDDFEASTNDIICNGASSTSIVGCNFILGITSSTDISASGAGTKVIVEGCHFDGSDSTGTPRSIGIGVSMGATLYCNACTIENSVAALQCGVAGDTSSTVLNATSFSILNSTTHIVQQGASTLQFLSGTFDDTKISISNPSNVSFAAFDAQADLTIGTNDDIQDTVFEILNGQTNLPSLIYQPSYYGNKGIVYTNQNSNPTLSGVQSNLANANHYVITGNRNNQAAINLVSDTNTPIGNGANVRGWQITKAPTSAGLAFNYSNNDTSGQAAVGSYTTMNLNGVNNQVEFPTVTSSNPPTNSVAKLVWAGDTDLYRASAGTLQTDGNFAIGSLSTQGIVHNSSAGLLSTSLIVDADVSSSAAIQDTKLATIMSAGKVANSATTAASSDTPNAIVARDGSGNFAAGTITAALTGAASLNVLKTGDTMTGNLNMANQSAVDFKDSTSGNFVGINAPATVSSSYTVNLPPAAPTTGQFLQASSPTALQWTTAGGTPVASRSIYVATNGNDSNNGSQNAPFASISAAVSLANTLSSLTNPIVIRVGAGLFIENNSGGSITITADGISIVGASNTGTIVVPVSPSNNLFSCTTSNVLFRTLTIDSGLSSGSAATGISISSGAGQGGVQSAIISRFQTGVSCAGTSSTPEIVLSSVVLQGNTTGLAINNARVIPDSCVFLGALSGTTPLNTAITVTGSNALVTILSNSLRLLNTGISATGGSNIRMLGTNIETTTNGVVATGACNFAIVGSNFIFNNSASINVSASGSGTAVTLDGCQFQCHDSSNTPQGTAIQLTRGASVLADSCAIESPVIGIACGATGDTSTTSIQASGVTIVNGTNHITQVGSSMLQFIAGSFDQTKITIADPTNVSFDAFDTNADLIIGTNSDIEDNIYRILNGQANLPSLMYVPSYYGNKGTVYFNSNGNPTFNGTQSSAASNYYVITTDRTQPSSFNIISDTNTPTGAGANVRGWNLTKAGTNAGLAFNYSNNDTSGQAAVNSYALMNLNGVANQVEFPLTTTTNPPTNSSAKLVWAGDTDLYRASSGVLQTDGNFVVGSLTPNTALISSAGNQLSSSVTTTVELGYLSGTTSSVQTQLNNKFPTSGGTLTGNLTLPAGTTSVPSLNFSGSTTTGLSAANSILSLCAGGAEGMNIAPSGTVTIDNLATTAGVVHNNASGNLSTSLIVNADISSSAAITDSKLATISTVGKVANSATTATSNLVNSAIVARDASGSFIANVITGTFNGNATSATSALTSITSTTATYFSAPLLGNVTGTQGATVVSVVGNQPASAVASATALANAATDANTLGAIVLRNASTGNFSAGTISASLNGNATSATSSLTSGTSTNFSGQLQGDVTGLQFTTSVAAVGGQSSASVGAATLLANAATNQGTANAIVKRDGLSNFITNMITLNGTTTNATDAATKSYVDSAVSTGFTVHPSVLAYSSANIASLSGLQTIDGVALAANNRVLLNGQTNQVQNGLWLVETSAWTRPTDFLTSTSAGSAYVLTTSGTNFAGTSWVCSTPTALIGTNNITFAQFSSQGSVAGANIGTGAGQIYAGQTGSTLNFKTVLAGTHITVTNDPNDVAISTDATFNDNANTIVARDGTGNFSAGTITAALIGNASTATSAGSFSGALMGDVTGFQTTTTVSFVGLQSATSVANATIAVNNATAVSTPSRLVLRDSNSSFTSNIITATGGFMGNLTGTATNAASANTATTAQSFSGALQGDVTGFQTTTTVAFVGGQQASAVANATIATTAATDANTLGAIVKRNPTTGNFSASTITATLNGNALTATTATNFSGALQGDVIGTQTVTQVFSVGNQSAVSVAAAATAVTAATAAATPNTLVLRNSSGSFTSFNITATGSFMGNLSGTATSATTANTATSAGSFTGLLQGDVTGMQTTTSVAQVGGQNSTSIANAAKAVSAATNTATPNTLILRDSNASFTSNVITATGNFMGNLIGNITGSAATAASATTAINFTGALIGDVTGMQTTTSVASVGGQTSTVVGTGSALAYNANSANNIGSSQIVRRDASGNFSASAITATSFLGPLTGNVTGNLTGTASMATNATSSIITTSFIGQLLGDVIGTQTATQVFAVGGQSAANVASATTLVSTATSTNTANTLVKRDGSGNFSAGTITATLIGNASSATSAGSFTGALQGDVTGFQTTTSVAQVGGQNAIKVAAAAVAVNLATNTATANTLVLRDSAGSFISDVITATGGFVGNLSGNLTGTASFAIASTNAVNFSGSLIGDVTGMQTTTSVAQVGGQPSYIVGIGSALAYNSNSANNVGQSQIVRRDASGNFSAGTITANLVGSLTGHASLDLALTGGTLTGVLILPAQSATSPSIQFTGSTNTGISAAVANTLSFDCNGIEQMTISPTAITAKQTFIRTGLACDQAVQTANPASNATVTTASTTSVLLLTLSTSPTNVTITFPPSPTNGQFFTIILGSGTNTIAINNAAGTGGATIVNGVTALNSQFIPGASTYGAAVTYYYNSTNNSWYRCGRG